MELFGVIIFVQIVYAYSAAEILVHDGRNDLQIATANIVNSCFQPLDRWSELLIALHHASHKDLENIHQGSETAISIVSVDSDGDAVFRHSGKCNDYSNRSVEDQNRNPPTAVMIVAHSLKHLKSVLNFLKTGNPSIWRPQSHFLIILETGCDVSKCNNLLKLIWHYWILNAVILCSSDGPDDSNQSEIELYTFNPYSADHSRQWETIVHETVEVVIATGNFNHSWYIFKQRFTGIRSSDYCGDLFFDKTSNLDGYVIPIGYNFPEFLSNTTNTVAAKYFLTDRHLFNAIARHLRFNFAQLQTNDPELYGGRYSNGTFYGLHKNLHEGGIVILLTHVYLSNFPGVHITYPHGVNTVCFMSRVVGLRPRWSNLAGAKQIWVALIIGLIFSAVFFYMYNRSHGAVSAMLDAQRLIIGSSVIHTSETIKYRIVLGSILLVVLVVDGAIRGRFISILSVPSSYPNLDTVEQLIEQKVDLYTDIFNFDSAIESNGELHLKGATNMLECAKILQKKAWNQRACVTDCRALKIMTSASPVIHLSSTAVHVNHAIFHTTMHWPMRDRYSSTIQTLVEAGMVKKWNSDLDRWLEVDGWKLRRAAEPPYVRPTKLDDLLPAIIVLFVGLSAALIVFAWEITCGKNCHNSTITSRNNLPEISYE